MTPSLMFPPLMAQDKAIDPKKHIQQLADVIVRLHSTAYSTAYKTKTLELTPDSSRQDPLLAFEVGNLVLYYQKRIGGRAHKLNSLWIGPFEVTFKRGHEYAIKLLASGRLLARIHARFLKPYYPPITNL